ncbi:FKBP-type peptidylprolyl isomerase [Mucilaginibacter robiniae]|uniref:Peptidyl-prolyl cis-trans isomerase n=1 Tax=Mucilaginibacter robiniae TaxID=2728022 RepID=A0A7L5E058_9SPHI|nr:FKBP-type peptidyl-prolyl cis-trans isomerase [Mucilaginibacter robiniae]QJD95878.1 FKBP-type peptidylprolyl isomerase [Mucilaginibacter robiniae]
MKKYSLVLLLFTIIVSFTSCLKDHTTGTDTSAQAATDDALIQAAIKAANITATKDPSGVYYSIVKQGTGTYPTLSSSITATYTGKLLDGTTFDSGTITNNPLNRLIAGWQIGVPYINSGGQIILFIPSAYGYGNVAQTKIPANSVLVFSINLTSFN